MDRSKETNDSDSTLFAGYFVALFIWLCGFSCGAVALWAWLQKMGFLQ